MTVNNNPEQRSAIARAARDPFSRRKFLVLTGGTGAAATFLAACGDDKEEPTASSTSSSTDSGSTGNVLADAGFGEGDIGILNYALTLEYLEAGFYAAVADSGLFKGDDLALIKTIGENEQEHVDALHGDASKKLGEKPAAEPKAEFPLDDAETVLKTGSDRREPRRGGVPGSGSSDREPGRSRGGTVDSHRRGPPRGAPSTS